MTAMKTQKEGTQYQKTATKCMLHIAQQRHSFTFLTNESAIDVSSAEPSGKRRNKLVRGFSQAFIVISRESDIFISSMSINITCVEYEGLNE